MLNNLHEGVLAFDSSHEFKVDLSFHSVYARKLCINGIVDKDRTC